MVTETLILKTKKKQVNPTICVIMYFTYKTLLRYYTTTTTSTVILDNEKIYRLTFITALVLLILLEMEHTCNKAIKNRIKKVFLMCVLVYQKNKI